MQNFCSRLKAEKSTKPKFYLPCKRITKYHIFRFKQFPLCLRPIFQLCYRNPWNATFCPELNIENYEWMSYLELEGHRDNVIDLYLLIAYKLLKPLDWIFDDISFIIHWYKIVSKNQNKQLFLFPHVPLPLKH